MEAKLDIWIILFIAAAAQGVFLSLMLILKRSGKKQLKTSQYILAGLMLTFTITIAYYTTYWTQTNAQLHPAFSIILRFPYLFGPLAFLYLYFVQKGDFPKHLWLHFVPFILFNLLIFNMQRLIPGFRAYYLFNIAMSAHVLAYAIANILFIKKKSGSRWLVNISYSFAGYAFSLLLYFILSWTKILRPEHDYIVSMGMTVFIYFIGYHGFRSPTESYGKSPSEKYQKSSLSSSALTEISKKLDYLMKEEKLFTNGDLKLSDVADKLELTSHAVSQSINVTKSMKFTDYLNQLRVEEAIDLMHSESHKEAKLLAVALDSGFNNKTSFLNAFKKVKGQSPSAYRASMVTKVV